MSTTTDTVSKLSCLLKELDKAEVLLKPQVKVTNVVRRDYYFPERVINKYFRGVLYLREDGSYYLTDEATMREIIRKDWINFLKYLLFYVVNKFDCENFSQYFKQFLAWKYKLNQVASVYSYASGHAFNIIFFPNEKCWVFEPQTGQRFLPNALPAAYKKYYIVDGQIVIV